MFITILAFFLALFVFTTFILGILLSRTKDELQSAKEFARSRNKKLRVYQHKFNDAVHQHNRIVDRWNNLPSACRQGKCKSQQTHHLSLTDLKRLRFYIHPDKHQGKTTDLAHKVNQILEEQNHDTFN